MVSHVESIITNSGSGFVLGFALLATICVGAAAWRVVYNLYFHPLKGFPGPWFTACTSLPLGIAGLSQCEPAWLCSLVEKYGSK